MRFLLPLLGAVALLHTVFSASLESAEEEEKVTPSDQLTQLQKIDQIEFEAAQKEKAAQINVTEEQNEDGRNLEAVLDGAVEEHIESDGESKETTKASDAAAPEESECECSEDTEGRQRRDAECPGSSSDETTQKSPEEKDM